MIEPMAVLQVPEGSIVVLPLSVMEPAAGENEAERLQYVVGQIERVAGHRNFTVLTVDQYDRVGVQGPEETKEALRCLVGEEVRRELERLRVTRAR